MVEQPEFDKGDVRVRKEYERQLVDVRQRIAVLQDVEAELTTSLAFLRAVEAVSSKRIIPEQRGVRTIRTR